MKKAIFQLLITMVFAAPAWILLNNVQAMEFHEIKAEELKSKMDGAEKLVLINPLSKIEFDAKNIPGSVNIPLPNIRTTEKLPKDKNQLIVTYCLGRKCTASMEAARLAAERGYTNIMVFRDGIPGWINAGYTITSASHSKDLEVPIIDADRLNETLDDYLIVDIRPASIYEFGYIPDSRAIPLPYLSMLSTELPKDRKIVVVDHTGKQSRKAAQWLMSNGFKDVSMLKDGLTAYANAGFALQK